MRAAAFLLALAFRLIPKRLRFRAAVATARLLEPLIARTEAYAERRELRTDGVRETSLDLLLIVLTRYGTEFDLDVDLDGLESLPPPNAGPIQLITPHTMLSALIARVLHDRGYDPLSVRPDNAPLRGTTIPAKILHPSPALLLQVRRAYAEGRTVAAMIDRGDPEPRQSVFETVNGPMRVSDAIVRLAVRHRAAIVFLATRIDDAGRVVLHFGAPEGASVAEVVAEFAEFVDGVLRRYRSDARPSVLASVPNQNECRPASNTM